jgi:hypothetical protein
MRILLMPFFATSHIGPFTDLAVRLATARPGAIEPIVAVTPANAPVVRAALQRHGHVSSGLVKIATYPFPAVDGLPPGVENLSAAGANGWRIDGAAVNEALMRPAQEPLLRQQATDTVINDFHFLWNIAVADDLGVPCVTFSVIGCFSSLALHLLSGAVRGGDTVEVAVPGFQEPEIRIPAGHRAARVPETPAEARQVQHRTGGAGAGHVLRRRHKHVRGHGAAVLRDVAALQVREARLLRRPCLTASSTGRGRR